MAVCTKSKNDNEFINKGKLGIRRRPDNIAKLPPFQNMLQVESLSADADVLTRERQTTSLEKLAAQKGTDFSEVVLTSLLEGMPLSPTTPVVIVDYTPTFGDNALAVRRLQTTNPNLNLYYTSIELDKKTYEYAHARVSTVLAEEWVQGKWTHPTLKPETTCPPLPDKIVKSIPGAAAAQGDAASVEWKVCALTGGKLNILDMHCAGMATGPAGIRDRFLKLEAEHASKYQDMLAACVGGGTAEKEEPEKVAPQEGHQEGEEDGAELIEFDSEAKASESSGGFAAKTTAAVQGVNILMGKDGKIYLSAAQDLTLNPNTQVGGIGGGAFQPATDEVDGRVPYHFPAGAPLLYRFCARAVSMHSMRLRRCNAGTHARTHANTLTRTRVRTHTHNGSYNFAPTQRA